MLASVCAEILLGEVETEIVQASPVFHTDAKAMERLLVRPQFDGPVTAGTANVLVDDVTCLGGTLSELADDIQAGGGEVAALITLINPCRLKRLLPVARRYVLVHRDSGTVLYSTWATPVEIARANRNLSRCRNRHRYVTIG